MRNWRSTLVVSSRPHSSSFGVHGRFAVWPPIARNHATSPVRSTAQRSSECSQSADEYMDGFYPAGRAGEAGWPSLPAPSAPALPALFGSRREDPGEHIRLIHVAFEMRLAHAAVVVDRHRLHDVVILELHGQGSGCGL